MRGQATVLAALLGACFGAAAACDGGTDPPPVPGGPDDVPGDGAGGMMVTIPAGAFLMGCNSGVVSACGADEMPYHSVVLSAYEIDRTEVTQSSYLVCVARGGCSEPDDNWDPIDRGAFPVTNVTWTQAAEFCAWTGRRLPTEAEWEKAARGTEGWIYPWGAATPACTLANFMGCAGMTVAVGESPEGASPYGVLDLAGNVNEWVADWYAEDAYGSPDVTDPTGPTTGIVKVLRGGSYLSDERSVRASYRGNFLSMIGEDTFGFRCARSIDTAPGTD